MRADVKRRVTLCLFPPPPTAMPDTAQTEDFSYRFPTSPATCRRRTSSSPTFIEVAARVRMALSRKELGTDDLAKVVRSEPLLAAQQ